MFGSTVLEVAAGVIFIYLVLSILCTSLNETIAQLIGLRAENLYETIHGLFPGVDRHRIAEEIYKHPLISSLSRKAIGSPDSGIKPSSITASAFSTALIELLGVKEPEGAATDSSQSLIDIFTHPKFDDEVMKVLHPLIHSANGNLDQARRNIETWFTQATNRATDWYKRKSQVMTLLVATALVVVSNADSLMIMDRLWSNPVQRAQIDALAKTQKDSNEISKVSQDASMALIGWSDRPTASKTEGKDEDSTPKAKAYDRRTLPQSLDEWMAKIIGLLITIFAVSLGAPFWFDKLSMVMNIRSGGKSADTPATPGSPPANPGSPPAVTGLPPNPPNRVASSDAKVKP